MGKQQERSIYDAPYRVYTLVEFQRLATLGIWPGANVENIGYVHRGRPVPKYIAVYRSKWTNTAARQTKTPLLDQINSGILYGGMAAGSTEYSKLGAISYRYKGAFNPVTYDAALGRGGGAAASIKTLQISGKPGLANTAGAVIGWAGIGISGYTAVEAIRNGNDNALKKALFDSIMGGVGIYGGPVGFIISTVYFLIDPLDPDKGKSETLNEDSTPRDNTTVHTKILTLEEQEKMRIRQLNRVSGSTIKRKF